jgi:ABC-type branched-subunit amino acid transport system substrate-binding protein
MKLLRLLAVFMMIAVLAVTAGCGEEEEKTPTAAPTAATPAGSPEATPTPTEVAFEGTIKLGFNGELTGPVGPVGTGAKQGIDLAIYEINGAGGVVIDGKHYELELVVRDDQGDAAISATNAQELVRDIGVKYEFGPFGTAGHQAVLPITSAAKVLTFSNDPAMDVVVTEDTLDPLYEYAFKSQNLAILLFRNYLGHLHDVYPEAETIAVLASDDASGQAVAGIVEAEVAGVEGLEFVGTVTFPLEALDTTPFVTSIKELNADIVYTCCNLAANVSIGTQVSELEAAGAYWAAGLTTAEYEQAVEAMGGPPAITWVTAFSAPGLGPGVTDQRRLAWNERLIEVTGEEYTGIMGNLLYQIVYLLVGAMEEAGTFEDTDAVSEALIGLERDDLYGPAYYGVRHNFVHPNELARMENGDVLKRVVVPGIPGDYGPFQE